MGKSETIPKIMKKHHNQLEGILNRFIKSQNEYEVFPNMFNKFKWELEKHFFLEEKAVFIYLYSDDKESNDMRLKLREEHNLILKQLEKIESDLIEKKDLNFSVFKDLLRTHRAFEDEIFYPKLEKELDESKKQQIIDRISNPI